MSDQNRHPPAGDASGCKGTVVPHIRPRDTERNPFGPTHSPGERSALTELNAMHAIGEALTEVPEEEARARVLAWAVRLFTEGTEARNIVARVTHPPVENATPDSHVAADERLAPQRLETSYAGKRLYRRYVPIPSPQPLVVVRFRWRS